MSKKRTALRFATAGAITTVYGLVAQHALSAKHAEELKGQKVNRKQVAIVAATLTALTWIVALA